VSFSAGQTTAQAPVTINDLGLFSGSETFRLIVQQNSTDPISTYLATDNFTINNNDVVTYSISPAPASVNENAGHLTVNITRSSSAGTATVYLSTVQDQGYSNNGYYVGIANQVVSFSAGQTTAQAPVTINDLGLFSGSETFRLIVQQNSTDPISTYLATDNFTINNNDVGSSGGNVAAGFDTRTYPGNQVMQWLRLNSNLSWVGYYLYPAPSRNVAGNGGNSWMGNRSVLSQQGWSVAPIYIGEQDPTKQDSSDSTNPSSAKGTQDGNSSEVNSMGLPNSAVPLLQQEGFPLGATVYLDIETSGAQSQAELDYVKSWCMAVSSAGYVPGIYCLASAYSSIATIEPTVVFWIANPTNPTPGGDIFSTMSPSGSGVPNATAWQYQSASTYTIPVSTTVLASGSLQVDLDVVNLVQSEQAPIITASINGNSMQLMLSDLSINRIIIILSSSDLKNWTPCQTNVVNNTTLSFSYPVDRSINCQYFRAIYQ
jgi:Domain of unknown function (DUF1906)/Calx-beta domain